MSDNIKALYARLDDLKVQANSIEDQIKDIKEQIRDAVLATRGAAIFSIIRDKDGNLFRITRAEIWCFGEPGDVHGISVHGAPKLKNGEFGTRDRYIGTNWEPVPS